VEDGFDAGIVLASVVVGYSSFGLITSLVTASTVGSNRHEEVVVDLTTDVVEVDVVKVAVEVVVEVVDDVIFFVVNCFFARLHEFE
jgi:hypothetical protein